MTPYQLAKAECANFCPDGACRMIEPSSLHDYRVALPECLSEAKWRKLVAEARAQGETVIRIDVRTGGPLDSAQPHANRHRLDLYYCPGCGTRMGCERELCPDCTGKPTVPDDVDRRCRVGRGLRCAYFERCILPLADQDSPKDEPALNVRRAKARLSYLKSHNLLGADDSDRECPDCDGPMPKGRRYCDECRRKRRRQAARDIMRKRRAAVSS